MAASCVAAIEAGITEIAFTDHVDHQPNDSGFGYYRIEDYFRSLDEVRKEFGDRLTILAGAEIDFHTDTYDAVERFVLANLDRYDFTIGSVHYAADGELIYPPLYDAMTLDDVFTPYLQQIEAAVRTGWFCSIGHLDIPKRYLPKAKRTYEPADIWQRLQPVFDAMIESSVGFEINTSGIRQAPKTSMPGPSIVRWYADAGGNRITTGTDSHTDRTIGAGVPITLDMLRLCGVPNVMSFRSRVGTPVPIDRLLPVRGARSR
jgi:histidinol-phosphatase (PHP family)